MTARLTFDLYNQLRFCFDERSFFTIWVISMLCTIHD